MQRLEDVEAAQRSGHLPHDAVGVVATDLVEAPQAVDHAGRVEVFWEARDRDVVHLRDADTATPAVVIRITHLPARLNAWALAEHEDLD